MVIPQRRSASVTAVAWRTSAGAAARVPIARATNLNRTLADYTNSGLQIIGLDADGDTTLDDSTRQAHSWWWSDPGKGLSRLVRENCDAIVSIPMAAQSESLNASVAAGVVLARDRSAAQAVDSGYFTARVPALPQGRKVQRHGSSSASRERIRMLASRSSPTWGARSGSVSQGPEEVVPVNQHHASRAHGPHGL